MYYSAPPLPNGSSQQSWESTQQRSRIRTRGKAKTRNSSNIAGKYGDTNGQLKYGELSRKKNSEEKHDDYLGTLRHSQGSHLGSTLPTPADSHGTAMDAYAATRRHRAASRSSGIRASSSRRQKAQQLAAADQSQLPQIASAGGKKVAQNNGRGGELVITSEEHSTASVSSIKGLKPGNPHWINQDNFFVVERIDNKDLHMYCVLDGHGEVGHLVSRRCRELFPNIIVSGGFDMKEAFLQMQQDLCACEVDVRCSGATCNLAVISGNTISVSNCGDSRCVLGKRLPSGGYAAVQLSNDHKPDNPDERKRVLSCGGHLGCRQAMVNQGARGMVSVPVGPTRVWYQFRGDTLGLAMSRSLGDAVVHRCGVSAEPETIDHTIADGDEFLILATDGIWDVVDNNQAVQVVQNFSSKSPQWNPMEAASWLSKFARSRWEKMSPMVDDITCIVVKIPHNGSPSGAGSSGNSISAQRHHSQYQQAQQQQYQHYRS